jgi:hypothetical protein
MYSRDSIFGRTASCRRNENARPPPRFLDRPAARVDHPAER